MKINGKGPKGGEVKCAIQGEAVLQLEDKTKLSISEEGIITLSEEGKKNIVIKIEDLKKIAAGSTLIFDDKTILDIVEKEGLERPSQEALERIAKDRLIIDTAHIAISIMVMEKLAEENANNVVE